MRKYIRHPSDVPIIYDLVDVVADHKEYLKNISIGGLCFRSNRYIEKDAIVAIKIPLVHPVFRGKGMVSWCREENGDYEIGVQFLDEDTGFRARMVEQVCYIEQYKREVFQKEGRELNGEDAAVEWIRKYARDFPGTEE